MVLYNVPDANTILDHIDRMCHILTNAYQDRGHLARDPDHFSHFLLSSRNKSTIKPYTLVYVV